MNMFEIAHSLNRQFGPEQWCIYRGKHLMTFVDNHDVSRLATILTNKEHLPLAYGLLFGMPGIPCIYYGSEWGEEGAKAPDNDYALRPVLRGAKTKWPDSIYQGIDQSAQGERCTLQRLLPERSTPQTISLSLNGRQTAKEFSLQLMRPTQNTLPGITS